MRKRGCLRCYQFGRSHILRDHSIRRRTYNANHWAPGFVFARVKNTPLPKHKSDPIGVFLVSISYRIHSHPDKSAHKNIPKSNVVSAGHERSFSIGETITAARYIEIAFRPANFHFLARPESNRGAIIFCNAPRTLHYLPVRLCDFERNSLSSSGCHARTSRKNKTSHCH